ncbi:hypothetical protein ACHAXA_003018 [Cyclostephanos tholiformis]|uniref:Fungal lipase-like domain-containing protein n=1 Tax=Cyclostephanos tholiformis TaxID=382380 RepID=A0ABD3R7X8_9STRA
MPRLHRRRRSGMEGEEVVADEGRTRRAAVTPPSSLSVLLGVLVVVVLLLLSNEVDAETTGSRRGARRRATTTRTGDIARMDVDVDVVDAYDILARSVRRRLNDKSTDAGGVRYDSSAVSRALRSLSSTQSALKRIDGAAHELYQRTHRSSTILDDDDDDDENWGDGDDESDDEASHGGAVGVAGERSKGGGGGGGGAVGGLKVAGRMSRNAARVGCVADALFAAELCELVAVTTTTTTTNTNDEGDDDGTLASWTGREVVFNATIHTHTSSRDDDTSNPRRRVGRRRVRDDDDDENDDIDDRLAMSVLVIYERDYDGGAGAGHGGVDDLLSISRRGGGMTSLRSSGEGGVDDVIDDDSTTAMANSDNVSAKSSSSSPSPPRGRYLVVLSDRCGTGGSGDLSSIISILDAPPERLRRLPPSTKMVAEDCKDGVDVCEPLYRMAGKVLEAIGPVVHATSTTTNATTLEGRKSDGNEDDCRDHRSRREPAIHFVGHSLAGGVAAISACIMDGTIPHPRGKNERNRAAAAASSSLTGSGRARASALCLGPPPCISSNIRAPFITSVIHGDDVVCRTTQASVDNLCDRTARLIKGGLLGRSVGWMSGAVSLTVSGIRGNNGGKKGEKLIVPGQVFLVRPRRMGGGSSSIHEVGGRGGESLRAALLWQLNDVLLNVSALNASEMRRSTWEADGTTGDGGTILPSTSKRPNDVSGTSATAALRLPRRLGGGKRAYDETHGQEA